MFCITFGKISFQILFVLPIPLFFVLFKIYVLEREIKEVMDNYPYIIHFMFSFASLSAGIWELFIRYRSDTLSCPLFSRTQKSDGIDLEKFHKINDETSRNSDTLRKANQYIPQLSQGVFLLIIWLIGSTEAISNLTLLENWNFFTYEELFYWWVPQQILVMVLSSYFLKYPNYYHHYFSFLLIIIGFIVHVLFPFWDMLYTMHIWYLFIGITLSSVQIIIEKWLMDKKYYSPYYLVFCKGCVGICWSMILIIWNDNMSIFKAMPLSFWCVFDGVLWFICYFITTLSIMMLIKSFNPSHKIMGDWIKPFLDFCILWLPIFGEFWKEMFGVFISIALVFTGSLIYNEIIIIHLFRWDYNTRVEIEKREMCEADNIATISFTNIQDCTSDL